MDNPPPFLPPRRPSSMPNLPKRSPSPQTVSTAAAEASETLPAFLPPRRPASVRLRPTAGLDIPPTLPRSRNSSRPGSLQSIPDTESTVSATPDVQLSIPDRRKWLSKHQSPRNFADPHARNARLQAIRVGEQQGRNQPSPALRRPIRHSSLRIENRVLEDVDEYALHGHGMLGTTYSDPQLRLDQTRPHSHPPAKVPARAYISTAPPKAHHAPLGADLEADDPYKLPPLTFDRSPLDSPTLSPKPKASLSRLSSLDNIITYREEKAQWKRTSSILLQDAYDPALRARYDADQASNDVDEPPVTNTVDEKGEILADTPSSPKQQSKFRHFAGEIGFCFTIAMTQFLAEYLISGFAVELPRLFNNHIEIGPGSLGLFWPASLLSLILSATLLIFARLSDMYGGYPCFMFGLVWLVIWTLVPGFCNTLVMVDVSRAMQGLAIAAFSPATFALMGSFYTDGPRKNFVLGLYSGCAPLGFFAGFLTAGALPDSKPEWYFWIASALSAVTAVTAFLTVPHDKTDRKTLGLQMDWLGSFLITAGLILLAYALAVEPYANDFDTRRNGFSYPTVYGPFCSGIVCLALAVWVEGWLAKCPLLPFDFFQPRCVKAFCFAGLCFYASYGVWLYNSAGFFQSTTSVTNMPNGLQGIQLALWYTPTAVGGLLLCVIGGGLLHIVPIEILLLLSGLSWIAAPLLLALCPLPLHYWAAVMPSMICATIGIDLTYTVSLVFLSAVQPKKYQGLCGAVCSILVNLAMSFSLPISEIVSKKAGSSAHLRSIMTDPNATSVAVMAAINQGVNLGYRSAFFYGAASAGLGFAICVLFVRIPRSLVREKPADEEIQGRPRETSSEASTLVEENHIEQDEETPVQSAELTR